MLVREPGPISRGMLRRAISGATVFSLVCGALVAGDIVVAPTEAHASTGPVITSQPADVRVPAGQSATFRVKASGASLVYQWYVKSGSRWKSLGSSARSRTYVVKVARSADNKKQFRVVVTKKVSKKKTTTVTSRTATLTTYAISSQPANVSVAVGDTAKFSVTSAAKGSKFQWYSQAPASQKWDKVAGATKAAYAVTPGVALKGTKYRVVVSGAWGSETSRAALLSVTRLSSQRKYFGVYSNLSVAQDSQVIADTTPGIVGWFENWDDASVANTTKLASVCGGDAIPLISWQSWDGWSTWSRATTDKPADAPKYPLAKIAAGNYDAKIRAFVAKIVSTCGSDRQVLIRFDHEMDKQKGNNPWYPWQGYAADYKAAWIHVVTLVRSLDSSIEFLWSPNTYTAVTSEYYPGDAYVDYVSVTLNLRTDLLTPDAAGKVKFPSFESYFAAKTAVFPYQKPMLIGEAGIDLTSFSAEPAKGAALVNGMFSFLDKTPTVRGVMLLNAGGDEKTGDYTLTASSEGYAAYLTWAKAWAR